MNIDKRTTEKDAVTKNLITKEDDEDNDIDLFFKIIAKSVKLRLDLQHRPTN